MYVHSTISVPDVDRILLSVGLLLEQMVEEPSGEQDLFNPPPTMDSARPSTRRADQSRARCPPPPQHNIFFSLCSFSHPSFSFLPSLVS
jgi:hypothetical protein